MTGKPLWGCEFDFDILDPFAITAAASSATSDSRSL